jgi:hypothetical protein
MNKSSNYNNINNDSNNNDNETLRIRIATL